MKYFKEMIDIAKLKVIKDDSGLESDPKKHFFKCIEKMNVFIFSSTEKVDVTDPKEKIAQDIAEMMGLNRKKEKLDCVHHDEAPLAAPLIPMSIEMVGDNFITVSSYTDKEDQKFDVRIACLVVDEISPDEFVCFSYSKIYDLSGRAIAGMVIRTKEQWAIDLAKVFVKRINLEPDGYEKVKERVKFNLGSGKEVREIKYVIHVCPAKLRDSYKSDSGREVDWICRFLRRGHWARFWKNKEAGEIDYSRIGKDRDGNYCVHGMTWHIEAEINKDREDLPIVRKQRVVVNCTDN